MLKVRSTIDTPPTLIHNMMVLHTETSTTTKHQENNVNRSVVTVHGNGVSEGKDIVRYLHYEKMHGRLVGVAKPGVGGATVFMASATIDDRTTANRYPTKQERSTLAWKRSILALHSNPLGQYITHSYTSNTAVIETFTAGYSKNKK
jgi:hypothetical protein